MLIVTFITSAFSAVVGIDIGSEVLRASVLAPGYPIEILQTSDSRRMFPTTLTIIPKKSTGLPSCINLSEVSDFDFVMNDPLAARKYPNSTIHHWSNFVAKLNLPDIQSLSLRRHFYATPSSFINSRLLLAGVFPELVFHQILNLVNASLKQRDSNAAISSTVISVPKFWPQQERDAIRTIARAKKLSPFIVDSSTAVSTSFAIEQQKYFLKTPVHVAFFDLGASNLQITVSEFSKSRSKILIQELVYEWNDKIGGRDFDVAIFDLLVAQYQYKLTPRGEQMILLEANRIKHRLTTDARTSGVIETPDGEHNLLYEITRTAFEAAIAPYLEAIRTILARIAANQSLKIDRVQLLGGCSRIPCVQDLVKECFHLEKLNTNMNPEEAIAIAAAWVGASKSSDYTIAKIEYHSIELWPLAIRTETHSYPLNATKLPMRRGSAWVYYNVTEGYPVGSSIYLIWTEVNERTTIRTTKDGLLRFQNVSSKSLHEWKKKLHQIAGEVAAQEKARLKIAETANRLEKLLLDTKQALQEESRLAEMATSSEREALANAVHVTDRWFLNQQSFDQESVEKKLALLEDAVGSVMCRVQNAELLPLVIENLTKVVEAVGNSIRKWNGKKGKSVPKRKDIRDLLRMVADLQIWYTERKQKQDRLKVTDNPSLLWNELRKKIDAIEQKRVEFEDAMFGRKQQPGKQKPEDVYIYPPESVNLKID